MKLNINEHPDLVRISKVFGILSISYVLCLISISSISGLTLSERISGISTVFARSLFIYLPASLVILAAIIVICSKVLNEKLFTLITKYVKLLFLITFILSLFYSMEKEYFGNNTIGSFWCRNEFDAEYYVNLYPNDNTSKNYRLKAMIHYNNEMGAGLESVAFPNGGYLEFDPFITEIEMNKKSYVIDNNSKGWYVELTNIKIVD